MKEPTFELKGNKSKSAEAESDQHFHMSDEYERHSSSQKTIGHKVIDSTLAFSEEELENPDEITGIDLACGPGNLTIELKEELERKYPNAKINLTGLDYTAENVERLTANSNGEISGIAGSFYELPVKPESMDIVTSNEGLH
ncbi:MAG: methyltransferase domain-containing protein [Candidatus Komeilibacteria bacterium]|jgi:ubiquinone/menaquinone biosynthesis C-methylase UbiE|nr:methyltransferase domain-containing protein [Candidatus Komeilibacteria bacterium]MBT4447350.1 methyltransferase domain-containing protein [Candidatus Komeilibacteria bacterium]